MVTTLGASFLSVLDLEKALPFALGRTLKPANETFRHKWSPPLGRVFYLRGRSHLRPQVYFLEIFRQNLCGQQVWRVQALRAFLIIDGSAWLGIVTLSFGSTCIALSIAHSAPEFLAQLRRAIPLFTSK